MRIGFDAKRLYNNFTGLGNYSRFVVEALSKNYSENEYVLFSPKVRVNSDTEYFQTASNIQTIVPSSTVSKLKLGSAWRTFRLGSVSAKENISIYHGLSHELPMSVPKGIGKVVTIHDLIFLRFPQFYNRIDVAIYKAKVQHACKSADRIIAISQQTAEDVKSFLKVSSEKINIVYQGCHSNFLNECTHQEIQGVHEKYKLPDNFILNVGTIEPRKNALIILKALYLLRDKTDIQLVIIGKPTSYLDELKSYAVQHGLEARIKFLHNVSFTDFPAIYSMASVFVYPSLFEGFGIPLVEAIVRGIPVISSTGSCFTEAAGPTSVYVDPTDDKALALQLENVLTKAELRSAMVTGAKEYVKRFQPQQIASDLMKIYKTL